MRINNYHLSWQLHGFTTTYDFLLLLLDKLRSKERGTIYIRYKIFYPLQLELLTQELPSYLKGIKTWTIGKGQSLMTNCLDADTPTVSVWFPRPKYWYKEAHSGALFCITFFPFFFFTFLCFCETVMDFDLPQSVMLADLKEPGFALVRCDLTRYSFPKYGIVDLQDREHRSKILYI